MAVRLEWARQRQQAHDEIRKLGGTVIYGYVYFDGDGAWMVFLHQSTRVRDGDLKLLEGSKGLELLDLQDTQITDAGLEHLKGLKNLQRLYLGGTQVTDEGVKALQQALPQCRITRKRQVHRPATHR
jgi:hypothetical protein